jgi:hypothetical protein
MALLDSKNACRASNKSLVERWAPDSYFQCFSSIFCLEARFLCYATQLERRRAAIGDRRLEIGLGIDNVSLISILVDRLPPHQRKLARSIDLFAAVPMSGDAEQAMIKKTGTVRYYKG